MTGIKLERGTMIYKSGQTMTALHLITQGSVSVYTPGGRYTLHKGDVIGIGEIASEVHFLTYKVKDSLTMLTYPFAGMDNLEDFLEKHKDVAAIFLNSCFRQVATLLKLCEASAVSCSSLYQELFADYERYNLLCERYRIMPRNPHNMKGLAERGIDTAPDLWLGSYYIGLQRIFSQGANNALMGESAVLIGLLRKAALDFMRSHTSLDEEARYRQELMGCYFHESQKDLFQYYTGLYFRLGPDAPESDSLYADISRMILQFQGEKGLDAAMADKRIQDFQHGLALMSQGEYPAASGEESQGSPSVLAGSLETILTYAGVDLDTAVSFRKHICAYKELENPEALDAPVENLRKAITKEFYSLYSIIFTKTLTEKEDIPPAVRMFLYFGYVDESLAGTEGAAYLYRKAMAMTSMGSSGIYTLYDWLLAIYQGKKQPSRNDMDVDYATHIYNQKLNGVITNEEYKALENNQMAKVGYELRNMFPLVNKMTYGRITAFCPIFSSKNMLKDYSASQVTASALGDILNKIRSIDYSAFHREVMDMDNLDTMSKERIHMECLPDIILMPGAGIRGVMWQEIEGKKRSTSARLAFPIFYMEDLETGLIRLTGEYRWEMCKRIQGSRWNDVSERSLTSEYFDYIQFYRKNSELTPDAKDKLRTNLQRAKNSFKEMFVRDYLTWILFEGNGSPRLNKVARRIFFTYCPFTKDIRESLSQHPLYAEMLARHERVRMQRMHHLELLASRIKNSGQTVPDSLLEEMAFTQK